MCRIYDLWHSVEVMTSVHVVKSLGNVRVCVCVSCVTECRTQRRAFWSRPGTTVTVQPQWVTHTQCPPHTPHTHSVLPIHLTHTVSSPYTSHTPHAVSLTSLPSGAILTHTSLFPCELWNLNMHIIKVFLFSVKPTFLHVYKCYCLNLLREVLGSRRDNIIIIITKLI